MSYDGGYDELLCEVCEAWPCRCARQSTLEIRLTAEDVFKNIALEVVEAFRGMVDDWRAGKPVTKLCYGLNNDHMKALEKMIYGGD